MDSLLTYSIHDIQAGATGAVAVVLTNLIESEGIGAMFYAIMLAGILQMIFGALRMGVVMRMVPHPVMVGFCNGLGLVIGIAQFNAFKLPESQLEDDNQRLRRHLLLAFMPLALCALYQRATMG